MTKFKAIISTLVLICATSVSAQTLDTKALAEFSPATMRQTFDVCKYVKLTPEQQVKLAKAIEKENAFLSRRLMIMKVCLQQRATINSERCATTL